MVKKALVAAIALVVLAAVAAPIAFVWAYGWDLMFAAADDADGAASLFAHVTDRIRQQDARDAADNGFDRLGCLVDLSSPAHAAVAELGQLATDRRSDTLLAMEAQRAVTARTAAAFESKVLPDVEAAAARSACSYAVDWKLGQTGAVRVYGSFQQLCDAMLVDGLQAETRGDYSAAASRYATALLLADRMSRRGNLPSWQAATGGEQRLLEALSELLSSGVLSSDDCARCLRALNGMSWSATDFVDRADEDFVVNTQMLKLMADGGFKGFGPPSAWWRIFGPLLASRASVFLQNYYLTARPAMAALDVERLDAVTRQCMEVMQRSNMGEMVSDHGPQMAQFMRNRTLRAAIAIKAALRAYRHDVGNYPSTLDALVPKYLKSLPPDLMARDGRFVYSSVGSGFSLLSTSPRWRHSSLRPTIQLHPFLPLADQKI